MIEDSSSRSGSGAGTQSLCGRTAISEIRKRIRIDTDAILELLAHAHYRRYVGLGRSQPSATGGLAEAGRTLEMADVRVLVAEGHDVVREGIRLVLETEPDIHVVAETR